MKNWFLSTVAIAALATAGTGCATKKFVRESVDPVSKQVGELDKRTAENARAIEQLDDKTSKEISRVGEKANSADTRAAEAAKQAGDALNRGSQAIEKADGARTLAENSMNRANQIERVVENLDNYKVATTKTILFGFDKASLNDDAKKELDELAQNLQRNKHYVVEIQGFTDTTGPQDYNYALSEKRAEAVVRYLTVQHKIPVYRIYTVGLGKELPAQAENRREARKLSRRVEVKVFTPDLQQAASRQTADTEQRVSQR